MNLCKRKRHSLLLLFFFACSFIAGAQEKPGITDLNNFLKGNLSDSAKTILINKAIDYYNSTGNDSATIYADAALQFFLERKYYDGQAWMIFAQADYDDTHGSTLPAGEKGLYALSLFKKENDTRGMADAYNLLGGLEDKKGNFDKAIAYLIEELKIYTASGDENGMLRAWTNMGSVYDDSHDTTKTLEYYMKADSISRSLPLSDNVIAINNDLGVYYFVRKDTAKAFSYFRKVLQYSDKPGYILTHIKALMNLGVMNCETGKKKEGERCLYDALALTKQCRLPDQETTLWMNFAWYFNDKPIDTLISYIDKAYELVKITGNKKKELLIYDAYAELYERKDNYKEANKYLKLERGLTDSMYNVNKEKELANIAAVYDLKSSNAKVRQLEVLIKRNQVKDNIIIGIALIIVLLCFVLLFYYQKIRRLNNNLEEGKKALAELNTMKDKLFSVIGHDMRGPIANIPVLINMIESEVEIPEEYKEALTMLKEHAGITIETFDKLMLLGKQYIKGDNFKPEKFNPKILIHKSVELISFDAGKKNITIKDLTPDNIEIFADASHFDFIVRNLLSNAIKFSFTNSTIEINAMRDTSDKNSIVFSVKDHGTGIEEQKLQHIFTASVTSTFGTGREKGNGIGLMLCKDFINHNNGRIWVESKKGEGTTFYFSLKTA